MNLKFNKYKLLTLLLIEQSEIYLSMKFLKIPWFFFWDKNELINLLESLITSKLHD